MLEVAQNWKSCSKVAEHNRDGPRGGEGGRGEMVGRRAQIYESAFFFVFFLYVRWFMMLLLSQIFFLGF